MAIALHAAVLSAVVSGRPAVTPAVAPIEIALIAPREPQQDPPRLLSAKPAATREPAPAKKAPPPPAPAFVAPALSPAPAVAAPAPRPSPQPTETASAREEPLAPTTQLARPAAVAQAPAEARAAPEPPRVARVEPPRFDAAYLNNPAPAYPAAARRRSETGTVRLRVYVNASGAPERIDLDASSGSSVLDRAAQDAVARWRFVPARLGNEAVGAWVIVPIVFRMEG